MSTRSFADLLAIALVSAARVRGFNPSLVFTNAIGARRCRILAGAALAEAEAGKRAALSAILHLTRPELSPSQLVKRGILLEHVAAVVADLGGTPPAPPRPPKTAEPRVNTPVPVAPTPFRAPMRNEVKPRTRRAPAPKPVDRVTTIKPMTSDVSRWVGQFITAGWDLSEACDLFDRDPADFDLARAA